MKINNGKMQKKAFMITVLGITILFSLLTTQNDAVNETNDTSNKGVNQNTSNTTKTNTTNNATGTNNKITTGTNETNTANTTNATTKSSNANLSNLGIRPHDFTGFNPRITSYQVGISEDIETVEVYAKTQHAKATVTGTGKKNLQKGENKVEVVVTAEDGTTKKTYTIHIVCGVEQGEYENANGLSVLQISNTSLYPEFKTNVYEYTAKYIGEDTKLTMEAIPTNENYVVEVTGNEDLQEGENIITILVSEKNGENVATYQITLNKSLVDEEAMAREEKEKKENQQKTILTVVIATIIVMIMILFIVIRHKRNKNIAEEFSGVSLYGKNNDDNEYEKELEGEEIPKIFQEKEEQETVSYRKEEEANEEEQEYDEDEIENMPKEELKKEFLKNYSNYEEDYEEGDKETKRKEKRKGKRFK